MFRTISYCDIMKLLGTSKISTDNKATIIKDVAQKLNMAQGDLLGFYEGDNGNIVIKKLILKPEQ